MKKICPTFWLSVFIFLTAIEVQTTFTQTDVFKKFAGEYITGHEFGGSTITLGSDGLFSDAGGSHDGTRVVTKGNYTLVNGKLMFRVTSSTLKLRDEQVIDLLDPVAVKKRYGPNETPTRTELLRNPIEWSGRIYLIPDDEMNRFVDAVNLGIEPRPALHSDRYTGSPWFGSFYMRKGDEKIKVAGPAPLPKPWNDLLLSKPVNAKVIKIFSMEKKGYSTLFTVAINKGSHHGLKAGMKLILDGEEPDPWSGPEVVSVEVNTAQVKVRPNRDKLKVGDKITSVYKPRPLFR
ncbi:MAG TPA: hypothetical protein PLL77_11880 [Pyrinomonadaceae bacterium]|nr:hypothetical protein [Pyrinomonadaceae bacterium]